MNITEPVLIFSAWQAALPTQDNRRHVAWAKNQLRHNDVQFTTAQGCYQGQTEPALVVIDTELSRGIVQRLCRALHQESILAVDANRVARLETCDGNLIESLGKLRSVPEHVAKARDAWTRVDNQFYITVNLAA